MYTTYSALIEETAPVSISDVYPNGYVIPAGKRKKAFRKVGLTEQYLSVANPGCLNEVITMDSTGGKTLPVYPRIVLEDIPTMETTYGTRRPPIPTGFYTKDEFEVKSGVYVLGASMGVSTDTVLYICVGDSLEDREPRLILYPIPNTEDVYNYQFPIIPDGWESTGLMARPSDWETYLGHPGGMLAGQAVEPDNAWHLSRTGPGYHDDGFRLILRKVTRRYLLTVEETQSDLPYGGICAIGPHGWHYVLTAPFAENAAPRLAITGVQSMPAPF